MGIVSSVLKALISIRTKERGRCEERRGELCGHCVCLSRFILSPSPPIPSLPHPGFLCGGWQIYGDCVDGISRLPADVVSWEPQLESRGLTMSEAGGLIAQLPPDRVTVVWTETQPEILVH